MTKTIQKTAARARNVGRRRKTKNASGKSSRQAAKNKKANREAAPFSSGDGPNAGTTSVLGKGIAYSRFFFKLHLLLYREHIYRNSYGSERIPRMLYSPNPIQLFLEMTFLGLGN